MEIEQHKTIQILLFKLEIQDYFDNYIARKMGIKQLFYVCVLTPSMGENE